MRHALVLALASTLLLTGCGSDDQAAPPLVDAPSAGAAPMPDASAVEAYDLASACDLLSVADVETAADGLGWGVVVEEPARCVYQDPDATHSVTLTLTSLAAYEAFDGIGVGAGASGMRALDTGEGRAQVWAPAGATAAVVVSQEPALLSADALVALTESAALALENAPLAGAGGASDSASAAPLTAGLLRVRLDGTIPSTGKTIEIDVSAARVAEAAAPGITTIACVGGSGDTGPAGSYAVLAMDADITDGLRLAQLEVAEEFRGPGEYAASLSLTEADGDHFEFEGTATVADRLDAGTFDVADRSGAQVVGSWTCEFAG